MAATRSDVSALKKRRYLIGRKIGHGSYANVHYAEFSGKSNSVNIRLACKIFDKKRSPADVLEKFFPRELDILSKIENPNIIQVHSILQRGAKVFIFMKYADNGDLLEYVKNNGPASEVQAKVWFAQICKGVQYLHKKNIAHRDLKCENILLTKRLNAKLADFGFACFLPKVKVGCQTYCGSAAYAAPEVVRRTPYDAKLADVWSLGVILFIMLNASMPFDDSNVRRLIKDQMSRIISFRLTTSVSHSVRHLVEKILEPNVSKRLCLKEIMQNNWIRRKDENE